MDSSQIILLAVLVLLIGGIVTIAVLIRNRKRKSLEVPSSLEGVQSGLSAVLGLITDTNILMLYGLILGLSGSALGYWLGKRKYFAE